MTDIKSQKLLYHLTNIENLPSILEGGLVSRSKLTSFDDIADTEIIESRRWLSLEEYVPFHFFARNPFDGGVQSAFPDKKFVLITVRRSQAEKLNWSIIPRHPLASENTVLLEYEEGMNAIDWEVMNQRDYHNDDCKSVCMAECLSPSDVQVNLFFKIFVATEDDKSQVFFELKKVGLNEGIDILVNPNMFLSES